MATNSSFYDSELALQMAKELRASQHNAGQLLHEGHRLIEQLTTTYASPHSKEAQELELHLCTILIKLWRNTDSQQHKKLAELIISCVKRIQYFL